METVNTGAVRMFRLTSREEAVDVLCVYCRVPQAWEWLHAADVVLSPPLSWGTSQDVLERFPGCAVVLVEGVVTTSAGISVPVAAPGTDMWRHGVLAYAAMLRPYLRREGGTADRPVMEEVPLRALTNGGVSPQLWDHGGRIGARAPG